MKMHRGRLMWNAIKADMLRWAGSRRLPVVTAGVVAVNVLTVMQQPEGLRNAGVVELVFEYMNDPFSLISFMLAASLMGTSYAEERESGFVFFLRKRCAARDYVISRLVNCFVSAAFAVWLGMMLWIGLLRIFLPWTNAEMGMLEVISGQGMGYLLADGRYISYYTLYSLGVGMMGGVLSVLTFALSVFLKDKLLVQVFPAMLFYLNVVYMGDRSEDLYRWSLEQIFYYPAAQLFSAWQIVLRSALVSAVVLAVVYFPICRKVRKEV